MDPTLNNCTLPALDLRPKLPSFKTSSTFESNDSSAATLFSNIPVARPPITTSNSFELLSSECFEAEISPSTTKEVELKQIEVGLKEDVKQFEHLSNEERFVLQQNYKTTTQVILRYKALIEDCIQ